MSLFLQAIEKIAFLARKADVAGTPRISITFDTDADEARFMVEINRDVNNTIHFKHHQIAKYEDFTIYGVNVRIL